MKHVAEDETKAGENREVFSVQDFCDREHVDVNQTRKLLRVLGSFATKQELHMNLQRRPAWR